MLIEALGIAARLIAPLAAIEDHAPDSAYMVLGPRVPAPVGYVRFCERQPDQCVDPSTQGETSGALAVTGEGSSMPDQAQPPTGRLDWSTLVSVNRTINAKLTPMSDEAAFGRSNYWTLPIEDEGRAVGNCKHFALEKRAALIAAGASPNILSLAEVRTRQGELHAVLIVATDQGDMVLDNLSSRIRTWRETGYRWLARQGPGGPLAWYAVPTGAALTQASSAQLVQTRFMGDAGN